MSAVDEAHYILRLWEDIKAQPGMRMGKNPFTERMAAALRAVLSDDPARRVDVHRREGTVLVVEDLTRFSNAFLRRVADEAERIIEERVNDGAFS